MSRCAPITPAPVPIAPRADPPPGRWPAHASCRPRMMQLTTMRAMKAPSARWISGTTAARIRSAIVTNVAMIRM